MRSCTLLLLLFPALAGCYRYTPVEPASVQPGTSVRARVSAAEAERIGLLLGTNSPRLVEGVLVENTSELLLVQVPTVFRAGSGESLNQRVNIPRAGLLELELRRLDRTRTFGLVALGLLAGGFVTYKAISGEPRITGPGNPGGGNSEARVPLRIPVR